GCTLRSVAVPALPCRSLAAIAHENAIEGCVREAYGALVATYQAERAAPALRAVFRRIAADERRHAALAEDVHAWIMSLATIDGATRIGITSARDQATVELCASLAAAPGCAPLGIPGGAQAVALAAAYFG
ncbi:MAG: ferritin-like domain-containing protein, partial [Myxococcota bacterium]|nr:ferritin-like domain-containing protein [Myxococcota bacterium]